MISSCPEQRDDVPASGQVEQKISRIRDSNKVSPLPRTQSRTFPILPRSVRKNGIVEDVSDKGNARFVYANENELFEGSTTPFAEAVRAQETRVTMGVSES